jgi:hypothetical protein
MATSISEIVPLAITMRERIEAMRDWARTRARSASQATPKRATQPASKSWLARHGADIDKDTDKASEPAGDGPGNGSGERKLEL